MISAVAVVDANVLLRHFLRDDAEQSPKATVFLTRSAESGSLWVTEAVVAEVLWVMTGPYHVPLVEAAETVLQFLSEDQVISDDKPRLLLTMQTIISYRVPFTDALLCVVSNSLGAEVLTFDTRDFKKLPCRWRRP